MSPSEPIPGVDFPPLENGIDYLKSVVEHLAAAQAGDRESPRHLKYAVLHLQAATEVLLKYRLSLEHWTLVLQNLDVSRAKPSKRMTRAFFEKGDFVSCTIDETVHRLRSIVGIPIPDVAGEQIASLARSRNMLQHYGLTDAEGEVEVRTAEVLDFLVGFIDEQLLPVLRRTLGDQTCGAVEDDMDLIREGLIDIRRYVKQRMERLADRLKPFHDRTVQCPSCQQWALVAGDGLTQCHFCPASVEPKLTAWDYATYILRLEWRRQPTSGPFSQPAQPPIDTCPACGSTTVVPGTVVAADPECPRSFCFSCATAWPAL
ncbi:hypothetical protein [Streptomyces clavifer]|uniref:hypothetical protein n=1 Tax=Streptomyces clavifer TaxID=68188 RepID=UPI0036671E9C